MSSTTDTLGSTSEPKESSEVRRKIVNNSLISLKCLLFFFFGGIGCLLPFLPLHMISVGLSEPEIRTISMISPLIAILGPLIAGPLADRVASSRYRPSNSDKPSSSSNDNGRYLRVMIAVCCVFSVMFYTLLLLVPTVRKYELAHELRPAVRFNCDENGAFVEQERCRDAIGCHRWSNEDQVGSLQLEKCVYTCNDDSITSQRYPITIIQEMPDAVVPLLAAVTERTIVVDDPAVREANVEDDEETSGDLAAVLPLGGVITTTESSLREARAGSTTTTTMSTTTIADLSLSTTINDSPHVCYKDWRERKICHIFSSSLGPGHSLMVNASLRQAINPDELKEYCKYPVAEYFECKIPATIVKDNRSCKVECQLKEPYDTDYVSDNVLAESQCRQVIGNEQLTFWMYLAIRSLADIFPTAALALIDASIVIATRETSTGRGDVGRQLAFGALGFSLFGSLSGYLTTILEPTQPIMYYAPLALHALLTMLAACIALSSDSMPLSPPEWWWHTRSGMLALPMSSVRKYGGETAALFLLLIVMGSFWSCVVTYLPIHLLNLKSDALSIGLALTLGALPAVMFLWKSEHLVDYCGHSNLLITAFIVYIVRFTVLSLAPNVWWALISQSLELFTLGLMWVTTILYFRHLISRQMTVTGQALPVIAHFCLGRAIGAVIGAFVDKIKHIDDKVEAMKLIYQYMAVAAAVMASLYFVIYHCILKPRCHTQTVQGNHKQPATIVQAMNGNGNYTPLRVYHNGMGRKGQFRY